MKECIINKNEAGQRLDKFLGKYLNQAPSSFYFKMLRKKNIVLNDKKACGNEKLKLGDSVKLYLSDETIQKFSGLSIQQADGNLDITYEDSHILLINKPVGMLSQKAQKEDTSLVEHIISYLLKSGQLKEEELFTFRPSICNRLDRNTSGLIVAGKSLMGLQTMAELFKSRSLKKYYRCLVKGEVSKAQHIKGYLVKEEHKNKVSIKESGEASTFIETEYRALARNKEFTLLEVHLITGRTHQIRAHLASKHFPIIGDYKYGDSAVNQKFKEAYGVQSQLLHAYRIEFMEIEGELKALSHKQFKAPLPQPFLHIIGDIIWEHGIQED